MPRSLRRFAAGGIYHVYNRFSSGEPVFADPEEALEFIELLRYVKRRDDWTVFAWVLMSNHYHLAIRNRATPISRGFQYLQGRFSRRFNRGRRRNRALWQSHYHAKRINGLREGVRQRLEDESFRQRYEELDRLLIGGES